MTPVVAVCPVHGPVDAGWAIGVGEGSTVTLSSNAVTCPRCGRMSRMIDGTFRGEAGGILTPIDAPEWSREALQAIQGPLQRAAAAMADPSLTEPKARREVHRSLVEIRQEAARMREENARVADRLTELTEKIERLTQGRDRWKVAAIFSGVAMMLGFAVDSGAVVDAAPDVVRVVQEIVQGFTDPNP